MRPSRADGLAAAERMIAELREHATEWGGPPTRDAYQAALNRLDALALRLGNVAPTRTVGEAKRPPQARPAPQAQQAQPLRVGPIVVARRPKRLY